MKRPKFNYRKWGTIHRTIMVSIMVVAMLSTMFTADIAIADTGPGVQSRSPEPGDVDVALDAVITVTFDVSDL